MKDDLLYNIVFENNKINSIIERIKVITFVLIFGLVVSCNKSASVVKIENSDNQWPMSGGPDGSWKIKTNSDVPIKWSVRNNQNIKWKKALPEGGQSGIAVWDNKIFFTINPPLNTPPFLESKANYELAKKEYDSLYLIVFDSLLKSKSLEFSKILTNKTTASKQWDKFLESNENYQKLSEKNKEKSINRLLNQNKVGKVFTQAKEGLVRFVNSTSTKLRFKYDEMKTELKVMNTKGFSANIMLYCMDADTGETLWTKTVKGLLPSDYNYGFSDSTTPCPITDGEYVWAINASGGMACFSIEGDLIWERTWMPTVGGPFNKQFDSVLYKDLILNVEPVIENDSIRVAGWNYLHAYDKRTGKRIWVTKEAITHYNTPIIGETLEGKPAILIARGGPHKVPERPVGLSLISLDESNSGEALWNWEPKAPNKLSGYGALNTQHWDKDKVSWIYKCEENLIIDSKTGKLISQKPLNFVNQYIFDEQTKQYTLKENVKLENYQNEFHCNMAIDDYTFYMVMHKPFIARHNIVTGKNEHLELPREINPDGSFIWKTPQSNDGLNYKGQLHSNDKRVLGNGFQRIFLGSPVMINDYIYFTNALGIVYVIDAKAENFDETALVAVNDLGGKGETWTANSLSFANNHIYHRTLKEIICIGN